MTMHAHTPMHVLKVMPEKHFKLLFGLVSRKQVSPLNLAFVMATSKWEGRGLMRGSVVARLAEWDFQSFSRWREFK